MIFGTLERWNVHFIKLVVWEMRIGHVSWLVVKRYCTANKALGLTFNLSKMDVTIRQFVFFFSLDILFFWWIFEILLFFNSSVVINYELINFSVVMIMVA